MNKFLSILIFCIFSAGLPLAAEEPQNYTAAPEFALPDLSGKLHRLSEFRGRVVLLDFWATWCGPCRVSTPALVELNKRFKGKKFAVIGVSLDQSKDVIPEFLESMKVKHLILFGGESTINETYRIRGIPAFYLLDKKGRIRKHYPGYAPGMPADWEKRIAELLAETDEPR